MEIRRQAPKGVPISPGRVALIRHIGDRGRDRHDATQTPSQIVATVVATNPSQR